MRNLPLSVFLLAEAAACFIPAVVCVAIWCTGLVLYFGNEHQNLTEKLVPLLLVLAPTGAGLVAAIALLVHILRGRKLLGRAQLLICAVAGSCLSVWAAVTFLVVKIPVFVLISVAPLACGLHLLYLGRSYFRDEHVKSLALELKAANKLEQATRDTRASDA